MRRFCLSAGAILALAACLSASPATPTASVTITQSHLVGLCVNGRALNGDRKWASETTSQLVEFTMRNEPRPGIESSTPGIAVVSFLPEAAHRYEIEVRAEPDTFSKRVWTRGAWAPVVRDRTTDKIVSGEPAWHEATCRP